MNTDPTPVPKKPSLAKSFIFSLIISVLFLGVLELGLRLANFNYTPRPRIFSKPFVGMFHGTRDWIIPTVFDPPGYIWLMPQTIVGRDTQGNKIYEWPMEKKPGVKRICFLGGSTTQPDYMIDYPRRTIALLNNALGAGKYEGLNLGMSSYSSHHSLIALKRYGLPRQPDCVVSFDGWNEFGMWPDGYSEKEHSRWMRSPNWVEPEAQPHGRVVDFRVTRLISKFLNMADRTWPRLNTDFNEFRDNLDEEIRICESHSIPMVVVKLPTTKRALTEDCLSEMAQKYYKAHFHTEDNLAMYKFHLMNCTNIQEAVVSKHPGVRMADAHTRLNDMHKEFEQNPHESVTVFIHDAKHCTPLGYQGIAEVAALAIEPSAAPQIKAYIASAAYWKFLALELQQMDNPFMCDYAVGQAIKRDAALEAELAPLRTWALSQYDFWRLYLANIRWAGPKVPLDQRLANLDKCIDMRPSDMGVLGSMFQAASWNGRTELAIPMLLKFKPTNDQDKYGWLRMKFQAYATARNWPETEKVARDMLAMNPDDQDAKAFFAAMQKSP
jgi:hypothetical protein